MPRKRKGNRAIEANERRGAIRHILFQSRMWMDVGALRHFVDAKRQVVEQDLKRLATMGAIEVASLKVFDKVLDRCKIVQMARAIPQPEPTPVKEEKPEEKEDESEEVSEETSGD